MLPINDRRLGSDKDSERQFIFKFLKEKYIGEGLGQLPSLPVTAEFNFLLGNRGPPPYGEAAKHLSRSVAGVLLVMCYVYTCFFSLFEKGQRPRGTDKKAMVPLYHCLFM